MKDFKTIIDCITSLLEDSLRFFEDQMTFLENLCQKAFKFIKSFVKKYKALCAIFCSITLLAFIFFAPFIFTRSCSWTPNFSETGQIGDTFGIMNPFIAIVAAILTFVAFWTQYQANKKMLEKDEKQEVEHQFYEMLRIHKENVNELKWDLWSILESTEPNPFDAEYNNPTTKTNSNKYGFHQVLGRHVLDFHALEYAITEQNLIKTIEEVKKSYKLNFSYNNIEDFKKLIKIAYTTYYEGILKTRDLFFRNDAITETFFYELDKQINSTNGTDPVDFRNIKAKFPKCQNILFDDNDGWIFLNFYVRLKSFKKDLQCSSSDKDSCRRFIADSVLFKGHYDELNHYFRHLYQMVKIIANYNEQKLPYNEKRKFLKMLRAQLTSDEQALLFYNWLSGYGYNWENDKNHFFTTYRMIHNINPEWMEIIKNTGHEKFIKMIKASNPGYDEYKNDNLFEFEDKMN